MATDFRHPVEIVEGLRQSFLDDSVDRISKMQQCLNGEPPNGRDTPDAFYDFRRELHSLKGTGSALGFPSISLIAHHLEDYLEQITETQFIGNSDIQTFVDRVGEIIEAGVEPDEKECRTILRGLPRYGRQTDAEVRASKGDIVLVSSARTIRHKVRRELEAFRFRVITVPDPIEAIPLIVRSEPDIVVCAATLDRLSSFDLIHALVAMPSTAHIPVALLTSFKADHPDVAALPDGVPVIGLGPNMRDELALALSALEYRNRENQKRPSELL